MSSTVEIIKRDVVSLFCLLKRYIESFSVDFKVDEADAVLKNVPQSTRFLLQYDLQLTATDLYSSLSRGNDMFSLIDTLNITLQMYESSSQSNETRTVFIMSNRIDDDSCFNEQAEDGLIFRFRNRFGGHPCTRDRAYSPSNVPRKYCKNLGIEASFFADDANITWDCQPIGESEMKMKLSSAGYSIVKTFALICHVPMLLLATLYVYNVYALY